MGLKGRETWISSRLINLADVVEVFHRSAGVEATRVVETQRSGGQLDPELARQFCTDADALLADLDAASGWDEVVAAEPALGVTLSDGGLASAAARNHGIAQRV